MQPMVRQARHEVQAVEITPPHPSLSKNAAWSSAFFSSLLAARRLSCDGKAGYAPGNIHSGHCPCCGKRIAGAPPADMPVGSPFGPNVVALVVYLHTRHMVSFNRLVEMLKGLFGLEISEGAIANMLSRAAEPFIVEAGRIEAEVRAAPVIASDETSARVEGQTCWQWVFGSATAVAHRIAVSRGAAVAADFLKGATPEVWISDRLGAQMGHAETHQVCLAHLLTAHKGQAFSNFFNKIGSVRLSINQKFSR